MHRFLCFLDDFIGSKNEYNFKHRFFNVTCLVLTFFYFARILLTFFLHDNILTLTLSHVISAMFVFIIFIISRYTRNLNVSLLLFFIVVLASFSLDWFFTGGTSGVMLFFYFSLFTVVIFISDKIYRIFVFLLILFNVSVLFYLEYKFPHLVHQPIKDHTLYIYLYFLFTSLLTFLIIQIAKTLYRIQKIEYIILDENGYERIERLKLKLTKRERDIFDLMLQGKKNRQIAALLFISECTVKTHINNIRKKIGDFDRKNLLILHNIPYNAGINYRDLFVKENSTLIRFFIHFVKTRTRLHPFSTHGFMVIEDQFINFFNNSYQPKSVTDRDSFYQVKGN